MPLTDPVPGSRLNPLSEVPESGAWKLRPDCVDVDRNVVYLDNGAGKCIYVKMKCAVSMDGMKVVSPYGDPAENPGARWHPVPEEGVMMARVHGLCDVYSMKMFLNSGFFRQQEDGRWVSDTHVFDKRESTIFGYLKEYTRKRGAFRLSEPLSLEPSAEVEKENKNVSSMYATFLSSILPFKGGDSDPMSYYYYKAFTKDKDLLSMEALVAYLNEKKWDSRAIRAEGRVSFSYGLDKTSRREKNRMLVNALRKDDVIRLKKAVIEDRLKSGKKM